jgi:hypothetical protein
VQAEESTAWKFIIIPFWFLAPLKAKRLISSNIILEVEKGSSVVLDFKELLGAFGFKASF